MVKDLFGMTALQVAVLIGDIGSIQYLLEFKADITVVTKVNTSIQDNIFMKFYDSLQNGRSLLELAKYYDEEYIRDVCSISIPYLITVIKQHSETTDVEIDGDTLLEEVCKQYRQQYEDENRDEIVRLLMRLVQ